MLNLLKNASLSSKLLSWAYSFGNHDFDKLPLVPPGIKVVLHVKPRKRASWAFHGKQGWYIGPAINYY